MTGKRRKNAPGGRHIEHTVKLTEQEEKLLMMRANPCGVTPSRFLAEAALGDPGDLIEQKAWMFQLQALRRQMKESGYSPELQEKASELLRRLGE